MRRLLFLIPLVLAIAAVHLLCAWTGTLYYLTQMTMSAYYSLLVIGLCVVMGYAGQISLGHAGFFAIGGYLAAAFTTRNLAGLQDALPVRMLDAAGLLVSGRDVYGGAQLVVTPWAACVAAVLAAALIALLIGIPVLKLKGHYLAMATLGFGIIIYKIALAVPYFGGADGISEVPPFNLLPGLAITGGSANRIANYYIAWTLVLLGVTLLWNLIHSRVGRALRAIHGSERAADSIGVDTARYKLYTFMLSAVFAALAGVFLTHYNGGIGPSEAGVMKSVRYVAIVAVGGMAHIWGALVMGTLLNFLSLRGVFGTYDDAVFGAILILIMLFAPEGILQTGIMDRLRRLVSRREED
ncbi:MAG: branched-chain amino acid ABC transporter permease [Desulfocapsaceae bacterium]|nr:branched-chain amino acid ABC transporter permease [Desulfocapsaceae bacterium]